MQEAWEDKIVLYMKRSESLLRCAQDGTLEMIRCWINEIYEILKEKFSRGKLFLFKC